MRRDIADMLFRPEYTGENRCLPCTVVNAAIAIVLGALLSRKSKLAGIAAVIGSAVVIYSRGYLVPGTPQLTKRYLPPAVLQWFGKSPEANVSAGLGGWERSETNTARATTDDETTAATDVDSSGSSDEISIPDDLEAYFLDADLLEPCEERDDLCLTPSFESSWLDAVEAINTDNIDLASIAIDSFDFDAPPDALEFVGKDNGAYALYYDSRYGGGWPSYSALVADLAAGKLLGPWLDEWDDYAPRQKGQLLNSLRMFLETCPTAEGGVRMGEEVVESCCSEHTVIAVTCEKTGERLFEHRVLDDITRAEDAS